MTGERRRERGGRIQGRGDGREEVGDRGEETKAKAKREVKWDSK